MDIIQLLTNNAVPIFIVAVLGFIAYQFFHFVSRSTVKPISREEIERQRFIDRMKINTNVYPYKWLYRATDKIGKIIYAKSSQIKGNPHNHILIEMVVQPTLFWKFTNPLAKLMAVQLNYGSFNEKNELEKICVEDGDKLVLPSWVHFDYYFGIYYDNTIQEEHHEIIKNTDLLLNDLNELASIYFVKSQEQTVFQPERALPVVLEEKRKQTEVEKRKGKTETI
jgi:heme/copper-type cytochrome/quinol oxidase subunit 2